jgi:hypothetical protein
MRRNDFGQPTKGRNIRGALVHSAARSSLRQAFVPIAAYSRMAASRMRVSESCAEVGSSRVDAVSYPLAVTALLPSLAFLRVRRR